MNILTVGIPVHGFTDKLFQCLSSIAQSVRINYIIHEIIIVNSGSFFDKSALPASQAIVYRIKNVPNTYFWSRSVSEIYSEFLKSNSSYILLLNHDCYVTPNCIVELFHANQFLGPDSICHSLLIDKDSHRVWWAGTKLKFLRRMILISDGNYLHLDLPQTTSSCMGQCLLLPRHSIDIRFLCVNLLPHYFSDSVQTTLMRRAGFRLFVIPSSIAFTDQTDQFGKLAWLNPASLKDVRRILFSPKSSRNLKSVFISTWIHRDSIFAKAIMAFYECSGKFLITLIAYIRNLAFYFF